MKNKEAIAHKLAKNITAKFQAIIGNPNLEIINFKLFIINGYKKLGLKYLLSPEIS